MKANNFIIAGLLGLGIFAWNGAEAFSVEVSEAPTTDLALTLSAIEGAQSSILLNIYELSSPQIADALMDKIRAGIHVEILEEGQPVGGMASAARGIQSQILQAMQSASNGDRLFEMSSKAGAHRRYRYDHAKYAVIDDDRLLVGSENYSPTGNPSEGSVGNRGWEVLIRDPSITLEFKTIFQADATTAHGDVFDLTSGNLFSSTRKHSKKTPIRFGTTAADGFPQFEAESVTRITSPDSSKSGLIAMIEHAKTSLDIQQMTFDPSWAKEAAVSPLYTAVVEAARRGVHVRVLVNDERVFDHPSHPSKPKNTVTVSQMNDLAQSEGLSLVARVANLHAMGVDYIHNKGALVDGHLTLISSINWDENAVEHNREAAVLLDGTEINAHYQALFDKDWDASTASANSNFLFDAATSSVIHCPSSINLSVQISELNIEDQADKDFKTLSNRTIAGRFVHNSDKGENCVLIEQPKANEPSIEKISERKFVELRGIRGGGMAIILEGYTPKTSKLYSIRAKLQDRTDLVGTWDAQVFDGSGPSKEVLGTAAMTVGDVE